ncbi:hypothetical protein ABIE89_006941 [Bradyrhizobium niftali]|uniref:pilus assembly protein N-terminal domain-containing protein n=1 Tax=Bradyrhizobium niftali TaxID=2560055 RepID=UPI0038377158
MKQFAVAAFLACLATGALAQPEEIVTDDVISMVVGQEKVLGFPKDISEIRIVNNGIVKAQSHTSKTFLLTAIGPGVTNVFFSGNGNGSERYHARVIVGPAMYPDKEPGHVVRMYGWAPAQKEGQRGGVSVTINNSDNQNAGASEQPDFVARYCSPTGCGEPMPPASAIAQDKSKEEK